MTRRSSVRALARETYCALAEEAGQQAQESDPSSLRFDGPTPTPNPSPQGGGEKKETELTARVRKLYEYSAVPVREIAAIAGVTERTIYKYAAKGGWKQRYRRAGFAPVKGAGARFIRRADKDAPVAHGIKATDPVRAQRAVASCRVASRLSAKAQARAKAEAEADAAFENWIAAARATNELMLTICKHRESRARLKLPASGDAVEPILMRALGHSLDGWEAAAADMHRTRDALPVSG